MHLKDNYGLDITIQYYGGHLLHFSHALSFKNFVSKFIDTHTASPNVILNYKTLLIAWTHWRDVPQITELRSGLIN